MIDSKTGERVVVKIHPNYGPFVSISLYEDAGALEDVLDEQYFIFYFSGGSSELPEGGGVEYFFGNAADPVKLQLILDSINFG